jgi:hypothetical protein
LTSGLVVAVLLFFEARDGSTLFSYSGQTLTGFTFLGWLQLGPVAAGLAGASGYLAGGMMLRLRPAAIAVFAVVVVAGCMVFMAQSAEFALFMMGWPQPNGGPAKSVGSFTKFLGSSIAHTPLEFWGSDDGYEGYNSDDVSAFFRPGSTPPVQSPMVQSSGDSQVDGIGGGVSGMVSSQDMSKTDAGKKIGKYGMALDSIRAHIHSHSAEWMMLTIQTAGFSVGGLLVMGYLRKSAYCKGCMLVLTKKGSMTRYYSRTRDMRAAVDEVLMKARDKQLQQAIHAQIAKGVDRDGNWSEYCSVMEIRRCPQCRMHMMQFRTRRKEEERWKDIDLLGFSTTSMEQLDFA